MDAPEVVDTTEVVRIFDTRAEPNVLQDGQTDRNVSHALRSFCEYLVRVPWCLTHDSPHRRDKRRRHVFVKQVRHRVDEDATRLRPFTRGLQRGEVLPNLAGPNRLGPTLASQAPILWQPHRV